MLGNENYWKNKNFHCLKQHIWLVCSPGNRPTWCEEFGAFLFTAASLYTFLASQFLGSPMGKTEQKNGWWIGPQSGMVNLGTINSFHFSRCWWHKIRETHYRMGPQWSRSPASTLKVEELKAQNREVACSRSPSKFEAGLGPEPRTLLYCNSLWYGARACWEET